MIPRKLVEMVKAFEGFSPVVYICPAGYPTIGYGSLCQRDHPPITKEEGEEMLMRVLPSYVNHALRLSPNLIRYEDSLVAISDFIYNLGPTRYAGSTLRKRVNVEDWVDACVEILKWNKGGGRVLPGLKRRREAEARLLCP